MNPTIELLLLEIRNLIASKEAAIAQANMELSRGGWTGAWDKLIAEIESDIQHKITIAKTCL